MKRDANVMKTLTKLRQLRVEALGWVALSGVVDGLGLIGIAGLELGEREERLHKSESKKVSTSDEHNVMKT
jgi:hypothetical protein